MSQDQDQDRPALELLGIEEIAEPGHDLGPAAPPILEEIHEPPELVPVPGVPHCGVCGDRIVGPSITCKQCETPHHPECWEYNEGCSIYGCKGVLESFRAKEALASELVPVEELPARGPPSILPLDRLASVPSSSWSLLGVLVLVLSFVLAAADMRAFGFPGPLSALAFALGNVLLWLSPLVEELLLWAANRKRPRRLTSLRDSSTRDLQARLAVNPKDLPALSALSLVHFAREDWKQASALYERALGLSPEDPNLIFRYAKCLDRLGDREGAKKLFTRIVSDYSDHHFARPAFHWLDRISRLRQYQQERKDLSKKPPRSPGGS